LRVAAVHTDAEGDDHESDEYITFENTGDEALDISGWTVEDAASHHYTVPGDVVIKSGAMITLYTESGTETGTMLYWGSDAAIWNNRGDTVYVRDDSGALVLKYEYS
jgi:competence protein ComEC